MKTSDKCNCRRQPAHSVRANDLRRL